MVPVAIAAGLSLLAWTGGLVSYFYAQDVSVNPDGDPVSVVIVADNNLSNNDIYEDLGYFPEVDPDSPPDIVGGTNCRLQQNGGFTVFVCDCPAGYFYDDNACVLDDIGAATQIPDPYAEVCLYRNGALIGGACDFVPETVLSTSEDTETGEREVVVIPDDDSIFVMRGGGPMPPSVTITKNNPPEYGGGSTTESAPIDPSGNVGSVVAQQSPDPIDPQTTPPPSSTANDSPGAGTGMCGGPGQPACAVAGIPEVIDSLNNIEDALTGEDEPTDIDETDVSELGDGLTSAFDGLKDDVTIDPGIVTSSGTCPPLDLDLTLVGQSYSFNTNMHCQVAADINLEVILGSIFMFGYLLTGIRVVMEA